MSVVKSEKVKNEEIKNHYANSNINLNKMLQILLSIFLQLGFEWTLTKYQVDNDSKMECCSNSSKRCCLCRTINISNIRIMIHKQNNHNYPIGIPGNGSTRIREKTAESESEADVQA